jgi:vacuolar-type H+-ATPase subunit D/Vma8
MLISNKSKTMDEVINEKKRELNRIVDGIDALQSKKAKLMREIVQLSQQGK